MIELNINPQEKVVVRPEDYQWQASPSAGVERMMLDRVGDELARATSLVRYEPNTQFSAHTHSGGEEYLVLSGIFRDEHGAYPAGTYVRNPIGTSHAPRIGAEGCTIFVKLWQFQQDDTDSVIMDTTAANWSPGLVDGLSVLPLHSFGTEQVALVRWAPHTQFNPHKHWGGEEILVLEGTFYDEHGTYPAGSWIRSPHLSQHTPFTQAEGATIYVKTGHLPDVSRGESFKAPSKASVG